MSFELNPIEFDKSWTKVRQSIQGLVVQKPINTNPRLKIYQMLFKADIRINFTLEEINLEKQK